MVQILLLATLFLVFLTNLLFFNPFPLTFKYSCNTWIALGMSTMKWITSLWKTHSPGKGMSITAEGWGYLAIDLRWWRADEKVQES